MTFDEQIALIKSTRQLHTKWYAEQYPDVAALGMEPAVHYLRYGAALGRNPGKNFDTNFYLSKYPDARESGLNPLIHYALHGQSLGYTKRPPRMSPDLRQVSSLRTKLLSLGFTDTPLAELEQLADIAESTEARAMAARELALWHMRQKTSEGLEEALINLEIARRDAPSTAFCRKLAVAEVLCHHFRGDDSTASAAYQQSLLRGELSDDLLLAAANLEASASQRIRLINRVLTANDIPPVTLLPDDGRPAYDRLATAVPLPVVTDGPRVTVLIAAYDAADMLPTALRSLQEQTWQNLEVIVLDDCSPNPDSFRVAEEFAARDPRIRAIRMEQNGGAYVARNRGLDEATGIYVTLHDADDWSHPMKIETQVRFMEANPQVIGCTSQQARAGSDLAFHRLTQGLNLITSNTSSFLWRRAPVLDSVGKWDTVRFGADTDLMKRIEERWSKDAIVRLPSGPLSFQRNEALSAVNDPTTAAESQPFGVRKEYYELRQLAREAAEAGDSISFPAPLRMRPVRSGHNQTRHFDVVIASDFRLQGGSTQSSIQELRAHKKFGVKTGLVQMYRYDFPADRAMEAAVRQEVDEDIVQLLTYGDQVTCDLLIVRYPPVLYKRQQFLPNIVAKDIKVIVNQPPMSDYGPSGAIRYELEDCAENVRHYFGKDATWYPIGPLVRDALHEHHSHELEHISLSDEDWSNIIDIAGWDRGPRQRGPSDMLRIGRHSRDNPHKWPSTASDILAAYPSTPDVEVHVLGGAESARKVIGEIPENWTVYGFGTRAPSDFLKDIDVWIYFSHPDWLESFGRTIIETMAVGVPVILPDVYRPLFEDAALYATPETAVEVARKLHSDSAAYAAHVKHAQDYVRRKFSFEMHLDRVMAVKAMEVDAARTSVPFKPAAAKKSTTPTFPK